MWCRCRVPLLCAMVGGEGDDQLSGSGRGAIAGCHCSVLWLGRRVRTNLGEWTLVPLQGAIAHTWWLPRLSNGYGDNLVVTTTTLCCLSDYSYCMVCMFISQYTSVKLFMFFLIENPTILGLNLISMHLHLPINVNIELLTRAQ